MASVKEKIRAEVESNLMSARTIASKAEDEKRELNADERTAIKLAFDSANAAKARLSEVEGDEEMMKQLNILGLDPGEVAAGGEGNKTGIKSGSVGKRYTESEYMKGWFSSLTATGGGYVNKKTRVHSEPVGFTGVKDILSGSDRVDGPGLLVNREELGLIDTGRFARDLKIRDLVTNGTTGSDTIHFLREKAWTNNAAFVPEAQGAQPYSAGAGQVQGKKPQSTFTLEEDSTTVKTIAHWIPVTKRALSDAAQIRTLIDAFLRYGLEEELEDSMVSGDGSGETFEGILENEDVQEQPWDTNILVTARKGKTLVRTVGKATATAYVFNPEDNEKIDLLRDASGGDADTGQFLFGAPTGLQTQTLWGLPRIESDAVPAGTGIVADWRRAILWDREQAAIQISDSHEDFFIRNLVAILAELRAAFTIIRPSAFVLLDLSEGGS